MAADAGKACNTALTVEYYRFFNGVQVADPSMRAAALEALLDQLASLESEPPKVAAPTSPVPEDSADTECMEAPTLLDLLPATVRVMHEW